MSEHRATIRWAAGDGPFDPESYPRDHTWTFPGGISFQASAAPGYLGNPAFVDPEEALVASLSSCHMLTFLAIAAKKRVTVLSYEDEAGGTLAKNAQGAMAMTRVVLRPRVVFGDPAPDAAAIVRLHEGAHKHCFIANSVHTEVVVEPRP